MNKSSISRRHKSADYYCSNQFDYQEDFIQFLEEARKNSCKSSSNTADLQASGKEQLDGERKNRKSWKNSLFSWLKTCMNSKSTVSKPRRGHVSGPVEGCGGGVASGRARRSVSGPFVRVFSSTGRVEGHVVPYTCLGQLNNAQKLHSLLERWMMEGSTTDDCRSDQSFDSCFD